MGVLDRQVRQGRDRASLFGIKSFRTRRDKKTKEYGDRSTRENKRDLSVPLTVVD